MRLTAAEEDQWSERGRTTSVGNVSALAARVAQIFR
jgi:hypothetical protein